VCGAALYIAAHIHGFRRKKADVVAVVHVGESTLQQRLDEFEMTDAGLLTAEEFDASAKQLEAQQAALSEQVETGEGGDLTGTLTCEHRDVEGVHHFAHGMCRMCFVEYCQVSGGVHQAGLDPPAFVRAELQRLDDAAAHARTTTLALEMDAALSCRELQAYTGGAEGHTAGTLALGGPEPEADTTGARAAAAGAEYESGSTAVTVVAAGPAGPTTAKAAKAKRGSGAAVGGGRTITEALTRRVQAALVTLAGQAAAEALCLPFSAEGFAKGQLDDRHLGMLHPLHGTAATRAGAHVKQVEPGVMHVLVAARCFTDDAVAYLDQWVRSRA
jgi:transcription factor IIIB subunit 2